MHTEQAIAHAQEAAHSRFASAHANATHARLIEAAVKNTPPAFALFPTPDNFEDAREYLEALAHAFDEIAYNVAREACANATTPFSARGYRTIFSDALSDSNLPADLTSAAERLREDALEVA